ncbi:MAG: DUF2075 domain-containing protein [Krumholzibacteria bacterium]|nr:DUF2075 domain-containing protein [Candidatus Krumholzibacteria bacterium]
MIVYTATKAGFREDVRWNRIEATILAEFQRKLGHSTGASEVASWKNSMLYMSNILEDDEIPADAGVAIEYRIPQTSKRIDFILTGRGADDRGAAVIVELKQWSEAGTTEKDGIVRTWLSGCEREVNHPSYQAWSYAALLEDYNEAVQESAIALSPCAYLHNMESAEAVRDRRYAAHLERAPVFIRPDADRLAAFIKRFIRHGDGGELLYEIDKGRIRPSKNLADQLLSMLQGNEEFVMIDDQKLVFETAMGLARHATTDRKTVLIVEGGPGTGKSVVAVNLLVRLTEERLTAQYVTKNAAPRAVYESVLTRSFTKSRISNLFTGSGSYTGCAPDVFDVLVVDEAHRLNEKSGLYQNLGENQAKEIISAAKCSIFFLDEDQRVTWKDVGTAAEIESWAAAAGATVTRMELQSQFRCNGSDGYLAWLDDTLQIRETANDDLGDIDFDFRVLDSPTELMQLIEELNTERNKARAVAGYCWDWISKKSGRTEEFDIVFEEHGFARRWNLDKDGSLWIRKPESVSEVGCIHTCQGLEVDHIGVIVGPDLVVRDGRVVVRPDCRSRMDSTLKGYKKALKEDPDAARAKAELIIKNTYRTLMSRGQKGCYVYCTDAETAAYFRARLGTVRPATPQPIMEAPRPALVADPFPGTGLRIVPAAEARPYENCVPIYDLALAAGGFEPGSGEDCAWVELPDVFRPERGLFVAQVIGESMNRRIPNGAWCLFRANPGGSREGKIVVVQHRSIADPDTGARFTVKRYRSRKVGDDGSWRHVEIVLSPESASGEYREIVIQKADEGELRVVGELLAVLG